MTLEEECRFFTQIIGDAKRTIICEQHRLDEIRKAVDRSDAAGILTVKTSPACPSGQLLVIDEQAAEASFNQVASRPIRFHGQ
ncbi:hypothetical protein [Streptomyces sp. NPDC048669]|uniref:hypothetical protein n=1 Tax=Streptomyces sp. NPDC048669 TaxID=3155267 RepID=UPI0034138956